MNGESISPTADEMMNANRLKHEERRQKGAMVGYNVEHLFTDNEWRKVWSREGLCGNADATPDDVLALYDFLREKFPPNDKNTALYQHLVDTAAYAVRLGRADGSSLNSSDFAVASVLRNSAGLTGEFEYFTKSVLSHALAERLEIRNQLRDALLPLRLYLPPAEHDERSFKKEQPSSSENEELITDNADSILSALDRDQWTLEIAGLLAKRRDGELMNPLDIQQLHLQSRHSKTEHAESIGRKKLVGSGSSAAMNLVERSAFSLSWSEAYVKAMEALRQRGISLESLRQDIQNDEESESDAKALDRSFGALMKFLHR